MNRRETFFLALGGLFGLAGLKNNKPKPITPEKPKNDFKPSSNNLFEIQNSKGEVLVFIDGVGRPVNVWCTMS